MNKGLSNLLTAPMSTTDESKYSAAPTKLCGIIESKPSITTADTKVYWDDVLKASDNSITNGKLTLTVGGEDLEKIATVQGWTVTEKTLGEGDTAITYKDVITTSNAVPINVGIGYIEAVIVETPSGSTLTKYKPVFFNKATVEPCVSEGKGKEDKVTVTNQTLEFTLYPLESGEFMHQCVVDTIAKAKAILTAYFVQES